VIDVKVNFVQHGDFTHLEKFLRKAIRIQKVTDVILRKYGARGVTALQNLTPKDTGETAASWSYEILHEGNTSRLIWKNSNVQDGQVIALLIQYGHGTRNGAYVEGIDYVNPAIGSIFTNMAKDIWKEVIS